MFNHRDLGTIAQCPLLGVQSLLHLTHCIMFCSAFNRCVSVMLSVRRSIIVTFDQLHNVLCTVFTPHDL